MTDDQCTACFGGVMRPTAKAGRTAINPAREVVSLPADLLILTCDRCGTEFVDEGTAVRLDTFLARGLR